jgi:hypothetical protein
VCFFQTEHPRPALSGKWTTPSVGGKQARVVYLAHRTSIDFSNVRAFPSFGTLAGSGDDL